MQFLVKKKKLLALDIISAELQEFIHLWLVVNSLSSLSSITRKILQEGVKNTQNTILIRVGL